MTLDVDHISDYLAISQGCIEKLRRRFCLPALPKPDAAKEHRRVDYPGLAAEYQRLLETGECKDWADVARWYGVSRAWVTMVMKRSVP